MTLSDDALDTDNESVDPSFDLDSSLKSDNFLVEKFCEDWVLQLDRDDKVSLGVFLCFQLSKHVGLGETKAAELAGAMIGRSVREWRSAFFRNDGCIPESEQGPCPRHCNPRKCSNFKKVRRYMFAYLVELSWKNWLNSTKNILSPISEYQ